ncbi:hypothetical protein [Pedobacter sp. KLB.chiD]|uniref:hypothetical protein n=1 Tax=Pedobacter sp. KLB.chiD TaxID=3387402 RepID=UPI00399B5239
MKMMRLSVRLYVFFVFTAVLVWCFAGCSGGDQKPDQQKGHQLAKKASTTDNFLSYTAALTKLPLSKFDNLGIVSTNKAFADKLPISIYKGEAIGHDSIIVHPYKIGEVAHIKAAIRLLVAQSITDSLTIGDFTRYFGDIKKEKPLIGNTETPLPVEITVDANTALKLTFNNNKKLALAHVTMVEILKYR